MVTLEYHDMGTSASGKTRIEHVSCNNVMLGVIKWYASWRRYVFYPEETTLFDAECMQEISGHLYALTKYHKGEFV